MANPTNNPNDLSKLVQSTAKEKQTPKQKVVPVIQKKAEAESALHVKIPSSLYKKLKMSAVENETTLKNEVIAAVEAYLS